MLCEESQVLMMTVLKAEPGAQVLEVPGLLCSAKDICFIL